MSDNDIKDLLQNVIKKQNEREKMKRMYQQDAQSKEEDERNEAQVLMDIHATLADLKEKSKTNSVPIVNIGVKSINETLSQEDCKNDIKQVVPMIRKRGRPAKKRKSLIEEKESTNNEMNLLKSGDAQVILTRVSRKNIKREDDKSLISFEENEDELNSSDEDQQQKKTHEKNASKIFRESPNDIIKNAEEKPLKQVKVSADVGRQISGEYEVEAIIREKVVKQRKLFFVKWQGWPSEYNTWEPVENLVNSQQMLLDYLSRAKQIKRKHKNLKN